MSVYKQIWLAAFLMQKTNYSNFKNIKQVKFPSKNILLIFFKTVEY